MRYLPVLSIAVCLALPAAASESERKTPGSAERPSIVEQILRELKEDADGETRRRIREALQMIGRAEQR
jgi:hypothetical protein